MHYEVGAIVVTDAVLYGPAGDVTRYVSKVQRRGTAAAKAAAPHGAATGRVNKSRANAAYPVGSLKASIKSSRKKVNLRVYDVTIRADVPYALFVEKGTGAIFSKSARSKGQFAPLGEGRGMYLPGNPGWGKSKIRQRVRGQRARGFLQKGLDAAV